MEMRIGMVSSVDAEKCTARVTFPDLDDVVSRDLPIVQMGIGSVRSSWAPEVNEQVACLFLTSGVEFGVIVGSVYSSESPAPGLQAGVLMLGGTEVLLGSEAASDPVVRKSDLQGAIDDLRGEISSQRSWALSHTHPAPGGATSAPTSPPPPVAPVTASGSNVVKSL